MDVVEWWDLAPMEWWDRDKLESRDRDKYVLRPYWLCMTYETKKGNNKRKEKKQIGEKRGFYQPVAKYEKQANISTKTSAKSSSVLKKKERGKKETKKRAKYKRVFL